MNATEARDLFIKHIPYISEGQIEKLIKLGDLYKEWNDKINVVSRKDIENIYPHHILHACAIQKVLEFEPESKVLDLGTGGGLPGIPLAIINPLVDFHLIDGRSKKITVVQDMVERLGLTNVRAKTQRAEEIKDERYDFVLARAVATMEKLYPWSQRLIRKKQINGLPNGLLCLKGGDLSEELSYLGNKTYYEIFPITDYFDLPYFDEKFVVYVQI